MNAEAWTILAVGVALGGLVWQMLRSLRQDMVQRFGDVEQRFGDVDKRFEDINRKFEDVNRKFEDINRKFEDVNRKFEEIADNFRDVRNRLDRLAADHHSLARELSELRGELRGRLDEQARPVPT